MTARGYSRRCFVTGGNKLPPDEERMAELDRYLRTNECERLTGLSRSTLWRLERAGSFPRRRKLSANAVGWLENEVRAWLQDRAEPRR